MKKSVTTIGIIALGLLIVGCAAKPKESGFLSTYDNLKPVEGSETWSRYLAPVPELKQYQSFILDPIMVKFYDPEAAKGISSTDIAHLVQVFYSDLKGAMEKGGYKLVTEPGPGVLRLRFAITQLKKGNPALNILPQTKLTGAGLGGATAEFEAVDSVSGKQVAAVIKSDTGSRLSLSGLSSWGDVESLMKQWSEALVKRLDEIRDARDAA